MAKSRRDIVPTEDDGKFVVEIENYKAILQARFVFQPGKITVAYGSNGAGKSESLEAVNVATGVLGTDVVGLRDGAERGFIRGFGREAKFTLKRCSITGEVDIFVVEEGFSLAQFVRPGYKTAESNDKQRLKDLASILGIEINPEEVYRLVGGFDEEREALADLPEVDRAAALEKIKQRERAVYKSIVSEKTSKAKDPAEYVAALKADCDRVALEHEKTAIQLGGEANALEDTLPAHPEGAETDAEVLSNRVANAVNAKRELQRRDESATDAERLAKEAERILQAGQGQTVAEAQKLVDGAKEEVDESEKLIADMEASLGRERVRLEGLKRRLSDLETAKTAAEERQQELDGARQALQSAIVRPTAQEWTDAEAEIKAAEDAATLGAKLREAADTRQKIADKRKEIQELNREAESLRAAAKSAIGLLVDPINALHCGIEIDANWRLIYVEHPTREGGRCPVEELSPGEAWALVIRLIVGVVGGNDIPAIMTIPQEALEGLDPINLRMFIEEIGKTQLMVFVAKATATETPDGDLVRDGVISKLVETWKDLR